MAARLRIRRAGLEDLRRILVIEKESFGVDAWSGECFQSSLVEPLFLVAVEGPSVCGYAIATGQGELESIAVAKAKRSRGVARSLLQRIISRLRAKGVKKVSLMVRIDNRAAIGLYRAMGFVRVRRVNGYYQDGAPGWRMVLAILANEA